MTELIVGTPLVWLNGTGRSYGTKIAGKPEFFNPASSVKDRIGLSMTSGA